MIRVRCIASLWSARLASTCLVHKTFLSSEASISNKTPGKGQNVDTEKKMKHHIETGNITDALKLFEESRNGGKSWEVDGCYSSLLHMFVKHDQHEAVDKLYEDIKRNASFIGEGAKTTMIKSYCNRGLFDKAVEMLRAINNDNLVHHTRHYDYLITSMAKSGLTKKALQIFVDKLETRRNCLLRNTRERNWSVDEDMIALLLNPNNLKVEENEHSKGGDGDKYLYNKVSQTVFSCLQEGGDRLPGKLLKVIHSWFKHDPVYHWTWRDCRISAVGTCSSCGNQLISGILPGAIHELQCEIIKHSNSPQQNVYKMQGENLDEKMHKVEDLKTFVQKKGPFDVIIDGMNVGSYDSGSKVTFSTDRLVETVHHFTAQQKKVLLVVDRNRRWAASISIRLEDVCAVFWNTFKRFDDLYVLYAAALSDMQHVEVVTNDRLKDYRILLPPNMWWTYLRWTRLNCVSFTVKDGKLRFFRQKVDPVVQHCGNSWHFPVNNETWRCATKSGLKR